MQLYTEMDIDEVLFAYSGWRLMNAAKLVELNEKKNINISKHQHFHRYFVHLWTEWSFCLNIFTYKHWMTLYNLHNVSAY